MVLTRMVSKRPIAPRLRETVHEGRDGWLFLIGGSNDVMERYRGSLRHWWLLRGWIRLITARAARAAGLGIRCVQFIVPEKLSVYDHKTIDLAYDPARASTGALPGGSRATRPISTCSAPSGRPATGRRRSTSRPIRTGRRRGACSPIGS